MEPPGTYTIEASISATSGTASRGASRSIFKPRASAKMASDPPSATLEAMIMSVPYRLCSELPFQATAGAEQFRQQLRIDLHTASAGNISLVSAARNKGGQHYL